MSELIPRGLLQPDPLPPGSARVSAPAYLMDAVRLRPAGRRAVSLLSIALFLVGLGAFTYPLFTDLYTAQLVQRPLADQFDSAELVQRYAARTITTGEPLTRIVMPALAVDTVVVQGTSPAALRAGAGHYPTSPLPGEVGNVAIAGHRTTYGKPFNELDRLVPDDVIHLVTPLAVHTYRVLPAPADSPNRCPAGACWIVGPTAWEVVGPQPGSVLTLTTCHPKGSAAQRLIVRAELESTTPRDFDADGDPVPLDDLLAPPAPAAGPQPTPSGS
jgi:sortase A